MDSHQRAQDGHQGAPTAEGARVVGSGPHPLQHPYQSDPQSNAGNCWCGWPEFHGDEPPPIHGGPPWNGRNRSMRTPGLEGVREAIAQASGDEARPTEPIHWSSPDANQTAEGAHGAAQPPYDARAVLRAHVRTVGGWVGTPFEREGHPWQCAACGEPWQGSPDAGGCDAGRGAREVLRLRAALEAVAECTATEVSYRGMANVAAPAREAPSAGEGQP